MKILHVASALAPRYGGPSAILPEMCAALSSKGHEVEILTTNVDGAQRLPVPREVPLAQDGFIVTYYDVQILPGYKLSFPLGAALRRRIPEFDIVHIHSLYLFPTVAAAFYCRRFGVPYLMRPHGTLSPFHRARHRGRKGIYTALLERRNLDGAAGIHYTSSAEQRFAEQLGLRARGFVVPHGVRLPDLERPCRLAALERRHPELVGRRLITFLGRLTRRKGVEILFDAFLRVADKASDLQLVIAGPDDEGMAGVLQERARASGLNGRVAIVGSVAGAAKEGLLRRSSVVVLPSQEESFGLAVVEALAAGTPVVISSGVALHQEVHSAEAGIVADRTPEAIAAAIARLADDPALAERLGRNGRALAESSYGWDRIGKLLESMYVEVISTSSQNRAIS